jgi:hypothetical protein
MKSILERIRDYVASRRARNNGDRTQPAEVLQEPISDRSSREDPYAEMRRVLAATMLLG